MAKMHPSNGPLSLNLGAYREKDVLDVLERGLPPGFDVFHNVHWSSIHLGQQSFGEVDVVVVSPLGHLMLLEIKAGDVAITDQGITKQYGHHGAYEKDVVRQAKRQHSALLGRLQQVGLTGVQVGHLLVLPDCVVAAGTVAYPRERIVDATQLPDLCQLLAHAFTSSMLADDVRSALLDFLSDRFGIQADPSTHIGQLERASTLLADGLATWVPRISHTSGVYSVEATAGSGKTQLALSLLTQASRSKQRAAYVCYNRPLADHLAKVAPVNAEVMTFHEYCVDFMRSCGKEPDFSASDVFDQLVLFLKEHAEEQKPRLELLVVDESQDFDLTWVEALMPRLQSDARLYILGDPNQHLYGRDLFDLQEAVHVQCMDNFRSPRRIVEAINRFKLTQTPVHAKSVFEGQSPGFHTYAANQVSSSYALESCLKALFKDGFTSDQIAVLSYAGRSRSAVLTKTRLADCSVKCFTGRYDKGGNPVWTDGELLVETLYRFKGQSSPVVVFCEIDFETLTDIDLNKLFVGFTRAQYRLECVLSDRAAQLLMERAE